MIERIQHLLAERGVKPRSIKPTLAKVCGISYEAVRQWFAGDTSNIRNENLMAIAEEYEVTVDWLLSGTKEQLFELDQRIAGGGSVARPQGREAMTNQHANLGALIDLATPRSRAVLQRINKAAIDGRLSEADIDLLDQIAARFESSGEQHASGEGSHKRLREKLQKNDPNPKQ